MAHHHPHINGSQKFLQHHDDGRFDGEIESEFRSEVETCFKEEQSDILRPIPRKMDTLLEGMATTDDLTTTIASAFPQHPDQQTPLEMTNIFDSQHTMIPNLLTHLANRRMSAPACLNNVEFQKVNASIYAKTDGDSFHFRVKI
jgi:hypothetical protein